MPGHTLHAPTFLGVPPPAADVLMSQPIAFPDSATVARAARLMSREDLPDMMIVSDRGLGAIVSALDVARRLSSGDVPRS